MEADSSDLDLSRRMYLPSDLDDDRRDQAQRAHVAAQALEAVGKLLNDVDNVLHDLEDDPDVLGSALVRGCTELADAIGNLVQQLDEQSDDDYRALAQACREDAMRMEQAKALENGTGFSVGFSSSDGLSSMIKEEEHDRNDDDMMLALSGAHSLLRDVEFSLRSIDRHDADEIADVALTLGRLFLISLQDFHATITPAELAGTDSPETIGPHFEILEGTDDGDMASVETDRKALYLKAHSRGKGRIRVLWPPLGPAVASTLAWGKNEAPKKPLLAVALGITLWPLAVMTAMMGAPLVIADGFLQDAYTSYCDAPLLVNVERGAGQLYQAGRLYLLCGGLVCRQTLRVVKRQVDRHGGPTKVAHDLRGAVVDRVLHPIKTAGLAWNGIQWGFGIVQEVINDVQQLAENNELNLH